MQIFVMWRGTSSGREPVDARVVATRIERTFAPLFAEAPAARTRELPAAAIASLDLPIREFGGAPEGADDRTWVYAPQYPLDAARVLRRHGVAAAEDTVLPELARALESRPAPLLAELAPPFALIWTGIHDDAVHVQNDGLGHACLYEYRDDGLWALTNRPFALAALGVPLEPDPGDWAVRAALGWFPGASTGFRRVRYLSPGTQLRISDGGVDEVRHDVLHDWLDSGRLTREESLELARTSVLEFTETVRPLLDRPKASLSGGWDSRAIAAVLTACGVPFRAEVRGPHDHADVISASRLSDTAGFTLQVRHKAGIPPADPQVARARIVDALLWQAGGRSAHQHKTFQKDGPFKDGGSVGLSGQHGEIGRSHYVRRMTPSTAHDDGGLLGVLTLRVLPFLREPIREQVLDRIRDAIAAADRYGLTGLWRWNFFYLFERTRRWSSAVAAGKPGLAVAPFLNAGYIRASYAYPHPDMTANPFHRHIIETLQPAWANVPFADDIQAGAASAAAQSESPAASPTAGAEPDDRPRWQRPGRRRFYDTRMYWEDVGSTALAEVLASDGWWTEVFDADAVRARWLDEPDEIAIVCLLPEALEALRAPVEAG
jgi:hypothetical protein